MTETRRQRLGRWMAAICGCLAVVAVSPAQPPPQPPVFSEVVEVRVVNLEVVVTDRQGQRVTGLSRDDFELRVDGELVPIEYFTEIAERRAVVPDESDSGPGVPAVEPGGAVRTNYLVFIDEYFSLAHDRDRVLERLIEDLPALGPEDRMAIVRFDGRDLEMVSSWSRDRAELASLLAASKGRATLGLQRFAELRRQQLELDPRDLRTGLVGITGQLSVEERYWVGRLEEQIERVVTAVSSTLRSFAAPPGRKVMLLLSGGWPYDPAEWVIDDPRRPITEAGLLRGEELFRSLSDTANLLGYTLYPVDVPGLEADAVSARDQLSGAVADRLTGRSFVRESGIHQTLHFLARRTGGEALINARREHALRDIAADLGSYYWLGFSPERAGDDQRHDIEVTVKRAGLEVRSRTDYFDFSREREITLAVESALYFGTPPSPEPLDVRLGPPERAGLRKMIVPLTVGIPAGAVTFLPGAGGWGATVELRVAVLDEDGHTTDTPVVPLTLQLAERPEPGTLLRYETKLKLRRKPHDLVVAIYDTLSGAILSSALEISP